MDPLRDDEIIRASWLDPPRFAEVFDRHVVAIHRFIARRIGTDDADSLVGEVFRVAFERRRDYRLDRPDCRPWLYGIAGNLIRSDRRGAHRQAGLVGRLGRPSNSWLGDDELVDRIDAGRHFPRVMAAVARLRPAERDVLLLVAWEELSYDEVAEVLAIPVGTVRSRLHRARRHLRQRLAELQHIDLNPVEGCA
jgi:RNA polymerase sigma factor (sigma-70 family)